MDIKSKLIALLSISAALIFLSFTPAKATVETGWPQGTPNICKNLSDAFFNFETGIEEAQIESTIPGVEFTTTSGINWRYADIRTGKYNYPTYAVNGNFIAWLGVTGDSGQITFTGGTASYVSALVSTYSGVTLDAYDANGNFLATSGWATDNLNTGTLTRLTVEAQGIAYLIIHDTGNYWIMDDLCTDAPPPCQPVPGYTTGNHDDRIDLVFVPDADYNGNMTTFLNDVKNNITQRLGAVAPTNNNLNRFNFYYTNLNGNVSTANCGMLNSLPNNLLSMCPYADAMVVLHTSTFSDCTRWSGATGIFSAEGAIGRSFIHEGGHGMFGLRDEYDSNRESGSCNYTAYNTSRPLPSNIWDTQADCRTDAQNQGWDPNKCYQFTPCQGDWWKLGDPLLANDNTRYNDNNFRFIMFDGTYFNNGFGAAAERRIKWVFDNLPVTPEPPLPPPSSEKSIVLELNINDSGLSLLKSGFVVAPPPDNLPGEYSLTAKTFSTFGNMIGEYGFADPRIVQAELGYTGPFTLESANFTLVLPYFNRIGIVDIMDTETGALLLTVDLSAFASGENSAPVAVCKNVTVSADSSCQGIASIDNGSYDPDGDPITITQSPAGPYGLGSTLVTLTVTDSFGASSSCTGTVTVVDTTPPTVTVKTPQINVALQDGVIITAEASDACGLSGVYFSVRELGGTNGIPIGYENLPATLFGSTGEWDYNFDTTKLPDGYYVILAKAVDSNGNEGWSAPVPFSIRNWAVIKLLPASANNKAGRTMPVKFALRISSSVDPSTPFVYNENLAIKIYEASNPRNVLQTSLYGNTFTDYRIINISELYITNFKTLNTPAEYVVEIWRINKDWKVGSFTFKTVK